MAQQTIGFLVSPSVSIVNGDNILNITGSVDTYHVSKGTTIVIGNNPVIAIVEGIAGSGQPDGAGNSTITLAENWSLPSVTSDPMVAFNTSEGMAEAQRNAREAAGTLLALYANQEDLLTGSTSTITIPINGVNTNFVPYQYLVNQFQSSQTQIDSLVGSVQAMTKAEFDAIAESNKRLHNGSGFLEFGNPVDSVNEGMWVSTFNTDYQNSLWLGRSGGGAQGSSRTGEPIAVVNGVKLNIKHVNSSSVSDINEIDFPPAPDGLDKSDGTGRFTDLAAAIVAGGTSLSQSVITRQDYVFLETWHEKISDKDVVYPLGNVQYGASSWESIGLSNAVVAQGYSAFGEWDTDTKGYGVVWSTLSDVNKTKFIQNRKNNIYSDGGELIQIRYRIRVVKGLGDEWDKVTPTTGSGSQLLRYDNTYRPVPQGQLTTNIDFTNSAECFANNTLEPITDFDDGIWGMRNNATNANKAHNGLCFALPIALVQRLNQGAYHPVYNPFGVATLKTDGGNAKWHITGVIEPSSISDCFNPLAAAAATTVAGYAIGTGDIVSSVSGRLSNDPYQYHDAIYAGQVHDSRSSARDKSPHELLSEYSKKAIAGKIRGREGVPFTKPITLGTGDSVDKLRQWYYISPTAGKYGNRFALYLDATVYGINIGDIVSFHDSTLNRIFVGVVDTVSAVFIYASSLAEAQTPQFSLGEVGTGNTVSALHETMLTTEFDTLPWVDIIGDPARIAATFPDGVVGQWIPDIPNGSFSIFELNRKNTGGQTTVYYSNDDGVSWSSGGITLDSINNTINSGVSDVVGAISLFPYATKANPYELANNSEVIGEVGDVWAGCGSVVSNGNGLTSSLIGKVSTGELGGSRENQYLGGLHGYAIISGTLDTLVNQKPRHLASIDTSNFSSTSPAMKAFPYITQENQQYYLQWVYKEMFWDITLDSPSEFISVDANTNYPFLAGQYYKITGLPQPIIVLCVESTGGSWAFSEAVESGGNYYGNSTGTLFFTIWDGNGFGDNDAFDIVDGESTVTDDNGNAVIVGQKRVLLPYFTGKGE